MRKAGRVVVLFVLSLLSTAVLGAVTALMAALSLAATALIVPGTGTPNANVVGDYRENFRDYYMQGTPCTDDGNCAANNSGNPLNEGMLGIDYPATFWPIPLPGWCPNLSCDKFDVSVATGVDNLDTALTVLQNAGYTGEIVIAGYSQGARVVSISKMQFANGEFAGLADQVSFVYIGNPNRPNGGILSRFGILGTIPILDVTTGQPTPTDTGIPTEDWAIRWEGIADFPQYLFNPLAVVNSLLGFYYDHGTYLAINGGSDPGELPAGYTVAQWREITAHPELYPDIVDIQTHGDTTYYTVTPKVLPIVRPLYSIPFIGKPIADLLEPALRVLIEETGYNRNISFGQPTEIGLIPTFNPIALVLKLIPAIFQGINNFLANFGLATEIPLSPAPQVPAVSTLAVARTTSPTGTIDTTETTEKVSDTKLSTSRLTLVKDPETTAEETTVEDDGTATLADETLVTKLDETPVTKVDETLVTKLDETPVTKVDETPVTKPEDTPVTKLDETPVTKPEDTPVTKPEETTKLASTADEKKSDDKKDANDKKTDTDKKIDTDKTTDTDKKADTEKKADTDKKDADSAKAAA